jgi:Neocarzinostatin family
MRSTRLISCLAIVGTVIGLAGTSASAVDPTETATPHKLLADGQVISVSAAGFAPDTEMAIVECPTTEVSPSACDLNTVDFTFTDSAGAYTDVPFTVSRILSDGTDCALVGGCYIGTQDSFAEGPTASTLIKFDPDIPPLPQLEVSIRWDKTPNVNSKGVVGIKGVLSCKNRGADVEIDGDLRQIYDRSIFESFNYTFISCSADTKTPFRLTMRPQTGIFGPGPAILRFAVYANNLFFYGRRALDLQASGTTAARATATPRLTWR